MPRSKTVYRPKVAGQTKFNPTGRPISTATFRFAIVDEWGNVLLKSDHKKYLQDVLDGSVDLSEDKGFENLDLSQAVGIRRIGDEKSEFLGHEKVAPE
jgi:hypothetical protein